MLTDIRYVKDDGTFLVRSCGDDADSSGARQMLLGARIHVDETQNVDGWVPARSVPDEDGIFSEGFIEANRISATQQLKVFYLEVVGVV